MPLPHNWSADPQHEMSINSTSADTVAEDATKTESTAAVRGEAEVTKSIMPIPSPQTPGIRKSHTDALASSPESPSTSGHVTFLTPRVRRSAAPLHDSADQTLPSDDSLYELHKDRGCSHDSERDPPSLGLSWTHSNEALEASMQMRRRQTGSSRSVARGPSPDRISFHRVVSYVFEFGGGGNGPPSHGRRRNSISAGVPLSRTISRESSQSRQRQRQQSRVERLKLSANAMMGRNSNFSNLTTEDKDRLGGIEYASLKLLLKVILTYYVSLHLIGIICLTPWIHLTSEPKYRNYLSDCGINPVWWSVYSAGTMANNLGFTLTPDSMISFRDSVFPILVMTILAYAGHTFYPICLRVLIWTMSKTLSKDHKLQEPLNFLLDHPRRCYTLLFPSRQTWILAIILVVLNIVDVILIICLDLDNPEVTVVPIAPRFISSIFQAASSRHTGTSTFNLANVNPGVQFSLLVMMYVSIFPIAFSVRSSNTYEESSLGIFQEDEENPDTAQDGKSYLRTHVKNQLGFDLWYIFLGCFCICCAEAEKIMDRNDPAFQVFSVFFEVASAYANVGLSLGHPSVMTSFSGKFTGFSKLVICAMMIRGRHRGLPVKLDRAIILPSEKFSADDEEARLEAKWEAAKKLPKLK